MLFETINKSDFKRTNCISKKYNTHWKLFAGRKSIGDCSNLFQRLCPTDYYDFYVKYTKDGEDTVLNRSEFIYSGRTEEEIKSIAEKYRDECNDYSYPLEDYIKNVYMHTIIETFDGQLKERQVNQILTNFGYTYEKPNNDEDSKYGIDFKVFKEGKLIFVIQVKPISFFIGNKNQSLINDRKNAFKKEALVREKFNVPTYYMIYSVEENGGVKWLCENNKLLFDLHRLCNEKNGLPYCLPQTFKKV